MASCSAGAPSRTNTQIPQPYPQTSPPHDNAGPKPNGVIWALTALSGLVLGLRVYCWLSRRHGLHIWDFDVMTNMPPLLVIVNVAGTFSVTAVSWSQTSFGIPLLHLTLLSTERYTANDPTADGLGLSYVLAGF